MSKSHAKINSYYWCETGFPSEGYWMRTVSRYRDQHMQNPEENMSMVHMATLSVKEFCCCCLCALFLVVSDDWNKSKQKERRTFT